MMQSRSDSHPSQEYIQDALSELLKRKPYNHITVTELCKKAGVARITFYKYYHTTDDVFQCLVKKRMNDYIQTVIEADVMDNYEKMLELCFSSLIPYATNIKNLLYCDKTYLIYEYFRDQFKAIFPLNYDNKQLEALKYTGYTSGLFTIAMEWLRNGRKESPKELAQMVSQALVF